MKAHIVAAIAACLAIAAAPAMADEPGAPQLALSNLPAASGASLKVTSPAFKAGGDIPFENTQYRGNTFPGLSWTRGPAGTKSYAIIMQDPNSLFRGAPILHWTMFNIPPGITKLAPGMTAPPAGSSYGPNIRGPNHPYMGPHTPPGPKHHYHLQVFALDIVLTPDAGAAYDALTSAMKGHVLAAGELIGLAQADPNAPPRAPAPATPPK